MEVLSTAKSGYDGVMSLMSKIGTLNIDHLEKLTEKQLASSKYYTDFSISKMKELQSLNSFSDVKAFSSNVMETGTTLTKKMLEDSKGVIALGSTYKDGVVGIVSEFSKKEGKAPKKETASK